MFEGRWVLEFGGVEGCGGVEWFELVGGTKIGAWFELVGGAKGVVGVCGGRSFDMVGSGEW